MTTTITKHATPAGHPYAVAVDPDYRPTPKHLSVEQVERIAALAAEFITRWRGSIFTDYPPTVYPPGFHSSGWTVGYEGAYEWTIFFAAAADVREQAAANGLFVEPVNGWCLGVYPA